MFLRLTYYCFRVLFLLIFVVVVTSLVLDANDNNSTLRRDLRNSTTSTTTKSSKVTPRHFAQPDFNENSRQGQCHRRNSDKKVVCTPDFFFIGSSKCGTSSLAYYLQTHPMIVNVNQYADSKENHRFDPSALDAKTTIASTAHYLQKFDAEAAVNQIFHEQPGFVKNSRDAVKTDKRSYNSRNGLEDMKSKVSRTYNHVKPDLVYMPDRPLLMEYTPNYLVHDETPLLIHKAFRHTAAHLKFLMIVREPVKRMISSWRFKMEKTPGGILSFKSAVKSGLMQAKCIENCFDRYFKTGSGWRELKDGALQHGGPSRNFTDGDVTTAFLHEHCSMKMCRLQNDKSRHGYNGANSVMAHVVKGQYMYELLNWLRVFDLSQFLVITLEEFMESPVGTMEKIISFLGLRMYHDGPNGPKRNDGMNLTYPDAARKMTMKGKNKLHEQLKNAQQKLGRRGWDNEEELKENLKIILNQRPTDHSLDSQITDDLVSYLKKSYHDCNMRLFKLLGWPGDYY